MTLIGHHRTSCERHEWYDRWQENTKLLACHDIRALSRKLGYRLQTIVAYVALEAMSPSRLARHSRQRDAHDACVLLTCHPPATCRAPCATADMGPFSVPDEWLPMTGSDAADGQLAQVPSLQLERTRESAHVCQRLIQRDAAACPTPVPQYAPAPPRRTPFLLHASYQPPPSPPLQNLTPVIPHAAILPPP